jgi:hypothetical protein
VTSDGWSWALNDVAGERWHGRAWKDTLTAWIKVAPLLKKESAICGYLKRIDDIYIQAAGPGNSPSSMEKKGKLYNA